MFKIADKARAGFPIAVDFTEGELPSAAKMNGLANQSKRSSNLLEYGLGDIWNQGGDAFLSALSDAQLMIPSVARYLGALKKTSPRIPHLPDIAEYTHDFTDRAGQVSARLPFPPHSTSTFSWTNGWDASPQSNKEDVIASGDWWIDYDTGDIFSYDAFSSSDRLTYLPGYTDDSGVEQTGIYGDLGTNYTFNVIPDPDTNSSFNFRGVKIEYSNGTDNTNGYNIYLPPRMPLNDRRLKGSPQNSVDSPAHSENFFDNPDGTPGHDFRFWQTSTSNAAVTTGAEHYRYLLPKLLTDNWSQAATLPGGFLYLWDHNSSGTGTIIEGLTFRAENAATPRKWVLTVTEGNSDALTTWLSTTQGQAAYPTANLQNTAHTPSLYPSNGLRLITVGSDISSVITSLVTQFFNHNHSEQGSLPGQAVDHNKLKNLFLDETTPKITPSGLANDGHPQYLHRHGYLLARDKYNGAMLGELVMSSTGSASNYLNITSNSNALSFGASGTNGFSLFWDSSVDRFRMRAPNLGGSTPSGLVMNLNGASNSLDIEFTPGGSPVTTISSAVNTVLDITGTLGITSTGQVSIDGTSVVLNLAEDTESLYLSSVSDNHQILTESSPQGFLFRVAGASNNSSAVNTLPGAVKINSTGTPGLYFSRNAASGIETRLDNTADGIVEMRHPTESDYGANTAFYTNRVYTGKNTDATYGDSGGTYGPVRELYISPAEFIYFNDSHSGYTWSSNQKVQADPPEVALYLDGSRPAEFVGRLWGDTTREEAAFCFPHIDFARYVIIGAKASFRHTIPAGPELTFFPPSFAYARLGYQDIGAGAGTESASNDIWDALNTYAGATETGTNINGGVWSDNIDLFTVNTGSVYLTVDQDEPGNQRRSWFSFVTRDPAQGDIWFEFRGVTILYRIWEH